MKILLVCQTMAYLSGSPLYFYELARELHKQGHYVEICSDWELSPSFDPNGKILMHNLLECGIKCNNPGFFTDIEFDAILISQHNSVDYIKNIRVGNTKIINIVHSEYDCETPISFADRWIAIRPSIKEHLISEHGIDEHKIDVIYNGIDRDRFASSKKKNTKRNYTITVIPCTLDPMREDFLNYMISNASKSNRIKIYGLNCGARLLKSEWVEFHEPIFNIEDALSDADYVAGILLGRVNLEAASMNIPSYIHNPLEPSNFEIYSPDDADFDSKHNIKNVAKQIINIIC